MRSLIALIAFVMISVSKPENKNHNQLSMNDQESVPLFSFGIISDVQYCSCPPAGTRFYNSSLKKLEDAFHSFATCNLSFVLDLGDLIDRDFASYKPVYRIIDSSRLNVYNVTGNHDYAVDPGQKKRIPQHLKSRTGYYTFSKGKFRFIILNGNEISTYSTSNQGNIREAEELILKLKNTGEINAINWNGGISRQQIVWLENTLRRAAANSERVFITCHFPVWPANEHNLLNYKEILPILVKYNNIIAWFNGHNHSGNYGNYNNIHFVTIKGMVETETTNSFAIVDVYKNKIWIRGNGREKSLILAC